MIPGQTLREYISGSTTSEEFIPIESNVAKQLQSGSWDEPQVNPNEILHNMLDHIHDGNREELVGELILMLGWLHKGGTMPNISKDTITNTTICIIQDDN